MFAALPISALPDYFADLFAKHPVNKMFVVLFSCLVFPLVYHPSEFCFWRELSERCSAWRRLCDRVARERNDFRSQEAENRVPAKNKGAPPFHNLSTIGWINICTKNLRPYNSFMLEKSEVEKYQAKLEQERRRVLAEIESEKPADFGSDVEGEAAEEESDESEEFNNKLAIQRALKDQLNEIDGALNRVRQGTYGVCIKCGKEIEKEILELVPESELCGACKKISV